jgi:hypothetical protein
LHWRSPALLPETLRVAETARPSRRRLLQAFSFVSGGLSSRRSRITKDGGDFFLLMFLAIWQLATIEPAGDFQPPLPAALVGHKEHAEYASCARRKRCGSHRDAVFGLRSFATECGAVATSGTIYRALRAFELISFGASGGILHCGKAGQVPGKKPS